MYTGKSVPNQEGDALLRGAGLFTDDVALSNPLYLHFVRSPVSQATIEIDDLTDVLAQPGVHAVITHQNVETLAALPVNQVLPMSQKPDFPILSKDRVEAVGQPIAAILCGSPEQGADAADCFPFDYDESQFTGHEVATKHWCTDNASDMFDAAEHVVSAQIHHPVLAPSPMEPRSIAVQYEAETDSVTIWQSTQTPHRTRSSLSVILGIPPERIRVIAPNVGGAFGMKGSVYPEEVLAVWAALRHKRNIRWTASRSEDFLSATHGRGLTSRGELAVAADGRFLALKAEVQAPLGHWVPNSGLIPAWNAARVLPSGYDIAELDITTRASLSAHPPRGIYRGAGRPEANMLMERLVDAASQVTGMDPMELRKRNLLSPARMPHDTPTGNRLDSGDYPALLDLMRQQADYDALIRQREADRQAGQLSGVGLAFYVEPSGEGWESARVTMTGDGRAQIASGSSAQGQWRATAYAQIAADALDLPIDAISVTCGDTGTCPEGIGALASRSTAIGGSAVLAACREVRKRRESGENLPITAEVRYENEGQAWGYGAYLASLKIDADTGQITLTRLICVDDTGTIINPDLVKGQITGGIAQGLGEALLEEVRFDDDGQLLTGSFMDYAMPRAADMPPIDLHSTRTSSPFNLLGAKGVGEAGTIGAPAAILNAAIDALRPLGVTELTMPLTPCKVWQAMQTANSGQNR